MLRAIREALETYASGMGIPAADVIREFKALPDGDKFTMLAAIKELEKKHQAWLASGGKDTKPTSASGDSVPASLPPPPADLAIHPPPEVDLRALAREQRGSYALRRLLGRQSLIVDRHGRPLRRG